MKLSYLFLVSFLVSFGIVLFGDVGLLSAFRISQENARLEARIDTLQKENANLLYDIESIQRSSRKLETMIRKNLSFVATDEVIYDFQ